MLIPRLFSTLCAFGLSASIPCLAAPINFAASGSQVSNIEAEIPLNSIAGIILSKGSVSFSGNTIEVDSVPDWLFDKHPVLTGVVIRSQMEGKGNQTVVSGLVYFVSGDLLANLGRNKAIDIVTTAAGTEIPGHIQRATETAIEMQVTDGTRKNILLKDVSDIYSSKAFNFEMLSSSLKIQPSNNSYNADATEISFKPAHKGALGYIAHRPQQPASNLPGTEGGVKTSSLRQMVAIDIANMLAPAIAVPLIFRGPSLAQRQVLQGYGNGSDGQPYFAPQTWANGTYHPFPFTSNNTLNTLIEQQGIASHNPLF